MVDGTARLAQERPDPSAGLLLSESSSYSPSATMASTISTWRVKEEVENSPG